MSSKISFTVLVCLFFTAACGPLLAQEITPAVVSTQAPLQPLATPVATVRPLPSAKPPTKTPAAAPTSEPTQSEPTVAPATEAPPLVGPAMPRLAAGQPVTITFIQMSDLSIGWAKGKSTADLNDHILRTTDGGQTWHDLTPPQPPDPTAPAGLSAAVFFMDAMQAWAAYSADNAPSAGPYLVWHTTDAGQTWVAGAPIGTDFPQDFFSISDLKFVDAQNGWMMARLGGGMMHEYVAVFSTADGGKNWKRVVDPDSNTLPMSCYKTGGLTVQNAQTAWVGGDCRGVVPGGVFLYRTIDGGQTWQIQIPPAPADVPDLFTKDNIACGADAPVFFSVTNGQVLISCSFFDENKTRRWLYATADGGQTWAPRAVPLPFGSAQLLSPTDGWLLGTATRDGGLENDLYQTSDGGQNWTLVKKLSWGGQLDFVSTQEGWAVAKAGDSMALAYTTTGGQKWKMLTPQTVP